MLDKVPLVGSMSLGYGNNTPTAPMADMPNLKEATQDFVSTLFSYMFEQMRSSMSDEENGFFSGEHAGLFLGFLDQEIGKKLSRAQGAELAGQLEKQLVGNHAKAQRDKQEETLPEKPEVVPISMPKITPEAGESIEIADQILDQIARINGV